VVEEVEQAAYRSGTQGARGVGRSLLAKRWATLARVRQRNLPPLERHDALTQFGRRWRAGEWQFRNHPKEGQVEVSLLAGLYSVGRATVLIARRDLDSNDGVRYARVSCLAEAGFELVRTPSHRNPDHVSVKFDGLWDEAVGERFDACFGEPVMEDG
jgi:hypothetical protein